MKDSIKQVIRSILLEFQQRDLPKLILRDISPPHSPPDVKKAWVLIGMRRSGKTWTAYQQMLLRQNSGLPKNTNLYINFEDDRLIGFEARDFQTILDIYFELFPQNINHPNLFFCFDEIQGIVGWEKFIRRLLDTETMQLCITGSSAAMLSKELGTALGGRAWTQEIFPFSFSEFLSFHNLSFDSHATSKTQSLIKHLAGEYLLYGGFPEVVLGPKELHAPLIQGYMDAVVLRDIAQRHEIKNVDILQKFLVWILRQLATPLSITKVYNSLKSFGLQLGKNSLFEYFQHFEDAYAILSVPFFSLSEKTRLVNPKKVYAVDPGIITAYSIKNGFERSSRFENAVFMHLRRTFSHICYYKTKKQKKEIDFVVTKPNGEILLFQACVEMNLEKTREREISALCEACNEFGLSHGTIITEDAEEEIHKEGKIISCIPYWKWAQKKLLS
jgi:uncharacterized protein